jgi:hypothetical protein
LPEFRFVVFDGAGRVAVPADDAGGGKVAADFGLDLLGAGADRSQALSAA